MATSSVRSRSPDSKAGKPGAYRTLGIPTVYDRVCQQALLQRLEPIFEPVLDEANFGYRRGRSTKDALARCGKRLKAEALVKARISDRRVLKLIRQWLEAGVIEDGR